MSDESHKPEETAEPAPAKKPRRDVMHGMTLEKIVTTLQAHYGWEEMANRIPVRCFQFEPSVKSSLAFLRKTPWARKRIEDWFEYDVRRQKIKVE